MQQKKFRKGMKEYQEVAKLRRSWHEMDELKRWDKQKT